MKQLMKNFCTLLIVILAFKNEFVQSTFDCFKPRFPITIGDDSTGSTDIRFIELDSSGNIYFGGQTTVTSY